MLYHLVVYCPVDAADTVRAAMADAGAGRIGAYDTCSFSTRGIGRFRPLEGAKPAVGKVGSVEEVDEERIEAAVEEDRLRAVITAVKKAHPYEEPAIHLWKMEDYHQWLT